MENRSIRARNSRLGRSVLMVGVALTFPVCGVYGQTSPNQDAQDASNPAAQAPASTRNDTGEAQASGAAENQQATDTRQADSGAIGDIVVTATRRGDQSLLDVAQAIDAYSGATLQQYKITSVQDLTKLNPSVNIVNTGASRQRIVLRGISSSVGQTTGVYLDEAPLVGPFNGNVAGDGTPSLRLHDIDHVEVLKGPQGTLFGASSMAGTLRVVTNKPKLDGVAGAFDMTLSSVKDGQLSAAASGVINLPVVEDRIGVRFVAWTEQGGGYIDKVLPAGIDRDANAVDLYGVRGMIRFKPSDNLTIDLQAAYQRTGIDGPEYVTPTVQKAPRPASFGRYTNTDPVAESYRENYTLLSGVLDYDAGFGNIIASGSYGRKNLLDLKDTSGLFCLQRICPPAPNYPGTFSSDIRFRDYTAELRFSSRFDGPLQVVAGGFYEDDRKVYSGAAIVANAQTGQVPCTSYLDCIAAGLVVPGRGANGAPRTPVVFSNMEDLRIKQYAFFGQADYSLTDTITATAGLRYFRAKLNDIATTQQNVFPDYIVQAIISVPVSQPTLNEVQTKTTYNASLLWKPTDMLSVYGRVATGFRVGGINTASSYAAQSPTPVFVPVGYDPDSLTNYELGAKFFFADRRVSFDISGYRIDWKQQQLNGLAAGTFNYTVNAGLTRTYGVEMSTVIKPTEGLTLSGSVNYVDAKLKENLPAPVVSGGNPGLSGDRIPFVPKWTFAGRGEYEVPLSDTIRGYLQTDFNYRDETFTAFRPTGVVNTNSFVRLPSFFLINARVGVRLDRVDLSAFVQNITNKYAVVGAVIDYNSDRLFTARPRTIGLSASAHF